MERKNGTVMKFLVSIFLLLFSFNLASIPGQMEDIKQDYRYELRLMWDKVYNRKIALTEEELERLENISKYANQIVDIDLFYDLAVVYMNIPEYEDAVSFMLAAAMSGHPYATYNLGYWHEYGFGDIEIDKKVAIKSYDHAFWNLKMARSGIRLSNLYLFDEDIERNYEEAIKILVEITEDRYSELILEEQDVIAAEHNLGMIYRYAMGVEKDIEKAIDYFKSASEKGNTRSSVNAAQLLREKFRETNNLVFNKEAKIYYSKASEEGDTEAMLFLGNMFVEEGYKYDNQELIIKGLGWVYLGNEIGYETEYLKNIYRDFMKPVSKSRKLNLKYLSNLCKRQNYKNCFSNEFNTNSREKKHYCKRFFRRFSYLC